MLKNRRFGVVRPPHEDKTTRVLENTFIDGNPISVPVDVPVERYNESVYNPDIVNPESILTSGQFIQGKTTPVVHDPADIEHMTEEGVNSIIENIDLES